MRYACLKNISENINFKFAIFVKYFILPCVIYHLVEKNSGIFFGILLDTIPCGDPEMSPLYLCSRQPLLSILKSLNPVDIPNMKILQLKTSTFYWYNQTKLFPWKLYAGRISYHIKENQTIPCTVLSSTQFAVKTI